MFSIKNHNLKSQYTSIMSTNIIDGLCRNPVTRVIPRVESCIVLRPGHFRKYNRIVKQYKRDPKLDTKVATKLCRLVQHPFDNRCQKGVLGLFRFRHNRRDCFGNNRANWEPSFRRSFIFPQQRMDANRGPVRRFHTIRERQQLTYSPNSQANPGERGALVVPGGHRFHI